MLSQKGMGNLKVLSVQISKRKPGLRIVKCNDGSVFRISEDAFILNPVSEGDELNERDARILKESNQKQEVLESAYYLLNYRMRSEAELQNRLLQKGFDLPEIQNAIQSLKKNGYVNDREFAVAFAREKVKNKHIGLKALTYEFLPHKIDSQILAVVYDEIYREFPPLELIEYHLRKLRKSGQIKLEQKEKNRIINTLKRKGFEWELIRIVIEP